MTHTEPMTLIWEASETTSEAYGATSIAAYSPNDDASWGAVLVRFYGDGASASRSLADCSRRIRMAVWASAFNHAPHLAAIALA